MLPLVSPWAHIFRRACGLPLRFPPIILKSMSRQLRALQERSASSTAPDHHHGHAGHHSVEHPSLAASTAKLEADVKTAQKEVARTRAELQDTKRKLQVEGLLNGGLEGDDAKLRTWYACDAAAALHASHEPSLKL
jgi:hypothetical protein